MRLRSLVTVAACTAALMGTHPATAADSLRSLAPSAGIHIGAAVDVEALETDAGYAACWRANSTW